MAHFRTLTGIDLTSMDEKINQKAIKMFTFIVAQEKKSKVMEEVVSVIADGRKKV